MTSRRVVIGVDVGGTNIDAVALIGGERKILSTFKSPTTVDPREGIMRAIEHVIRDAHLKAEDISSVAIGTTHFVNAVVTHNGSKLDRVAVVRLGAPYTAACPPFIDFPLALRALVEGPFLLCKGGLQIDGSRIADVDEDEIIRGCKNLKQTDVAAVVVTGIYSVLDDDEKAQEYQAARIIKRELPGIKIVCSRDVGTDGLVEREGAAILNASLLRFAETTLVSFQNGIQALGLQCPMFLTQNDGTLCTLARAAKLPIRTFSSGATNSMRGASYLASLDSSIKTSGKPIIVIDIGGTTTDIGVLLPSGFPRQAAAFVSIAGVRTCFAMPDVVSIGLGGGSLVSEKDGKFFVGPQSTGYRLLEEGIVFGGKTVTATDIAVAAGRAPGVGDVSKVQSMFSPEKVMASMAAMKRLLERAIAAAKTWPEPATILVVGGGAILTPKTLEGAKDIICPKHFDCANAVGAAVARVSGEIDTIKSLLNTTFTLCVGPLKELAIKKAVEAGAKRDSVQIVEVQNLPVQYVTTGATKIRIRAAGDLDYDRALEQTAECMVAREVEKDAMRFNEKEGTPRLVTAYPGAVKFATEWTLAEIETYRPRIHPDKTWELSELDLHWIGEGCGVLGVGGGGSTFNIMIMCREVIRKGGRIRVVDIEDMDNDALIGRCCMMGSPSVSEERLQAGPELLDAMTVLTNFLRIPLSDIKAIMSDEIGGGNGVQPALLASSAYMDVPLLDGMCGAGWMGGEVRQRMAALGMLNESVPNPAADLMGRAYPFLFSTLPVAYGIPGCLPPTAFVDAMGNRAIAISGDNRRRPEEFLRAVCDKMGSMARVSGRRRAPHLAGKRGRPLISLTLSLALGTDINQGMYSAHPLTIAQIRQHGVLNSYSQAWRLGRAMHVRRLRNDFARLPDAIFALQTGRIVFHGKCTEVYRHIKNAWTFGHLRIRPLDLDELEDEDRGSTRDDNGVDNHERAENGGVEEPVDELCIQFQNEYICCTSTRRDGTTRLHAIVPDLITILDSHSGVALGTHEVRYGLRMTVIALACDPKWTTPQGLEYGGPAVWDLGFAYASQLGQYREPASVIREYGVGGGSSAVPSTLSSLTD